MTFGALLNVAAFPIQNTAEIVSLLASSFSCFLLVLFPFMTATLLYDNRKEIKKGNQKYLSRFGTMYKDFKVNKEWYLFQYYSVFLFRRLVFVTFLIVFLKYPQIQCNSFILGSYLMFSYQV